VYNRGRAAPRSARHRTTTASKVELTTLRASGRPSRVTNSCGRGVVRT
jgi:hypothetical protein